MVKEAYDSGYDSAMEKMAISMRWIVDKTSRGVNSRLLKPHNAKAAKRMSAEVSAPGVEAMMDRNPLAQKTISILDKSKGNARFRDLPSELRQDAMQGIKNLGRQLPK